MSLVEYTEQLLLSSRRDQVRALVKIYFGFLFQEEGTGLKPLHWIGKIDSQLWSYSGIVWKR